MIYKKYQLGFFLRVMLLTLAIALLMYWLFVDKHYLRCIYVFIVIIYIVWSIFKYISQISRDFFSFISALANEEYAIQFADEKNSKNLQRLYHLYNTTAKRFHKIKYERDLQHLFLEEILNQIEVGIIAFDKNEEVLLMNRAFKTLFRCKKHKNLSEHNDFIKNLTKEIKPGNRKLIFPTIEGEKHIFSAHSTEFILKERNLTLQYFHNIKTEMDEQELESWQKLFSVLTHEIMNSVTPISSLSSSLNDKLKFDLKENGVAEPKTLKLLLEGLEAVSIRTKGLLSFTESFRQLSKIPKPKTMVIDIKNFMERINTLYSPTVQTKNIQFKYSISNEISTIIADPQQIEQVLINIINNAIDALEDLPNGKISIKTYLDSKGKTTIVVTDNGKGISDDVLEKIFIPFFTTKAKGNGIGLSLSRQIIRMHGGSIEIKSKVGFGTSVKISYLPN